MHALIRGNHLLKFSKLPTALVLALLACTACERNADQTRNAMDEAKASETPTATAAAPRARELASTSPGAPARTTLGYLCPAGPECESDLLGASSTEEAEWLIRNGYPSTEELKRLSSLSDSQLKKEADAGSLPAMVSHGLRLVDQGDSVAGRVSIFDATQRGSIYGYYAMSSVYQSTPGLASRVESGAYLRVAYILGDVKAAEELQRRFPGLGQVEQAAIDKRAAALYQTFARSQQPSPRP